METISHATFINIEFHSIVDGHKYVFNYSSSEFGKISAPGSSIVSVNTSKSLDNPAGRFTIRAINRDIIIKARTSTKLTPYRITNPNEYENTMDIGDEGSRNQGDRVSWFDFIMPMTLVKITFNNDRIMNGFITDIRRTTSMGGDGKPNISIDMSGMEFGGLTIMHKIYYENLAPQLSEDIMGLSPLLKILQNGYNIRGDKIENIVREMWTELFAKPLMNAKFFWADNSDITQKLDLIISRNLNYNFTMNMNVIQYVGDFWNLFKSVIQFPFNEMFFDVGGKNRILSTYPQIGDNVKGVAFEYESTQANDIAEIENDSLYNGDVNKTYLIIRPTPFDAFYDEQFYDNNLKPFEPSKPIDYVKRHRKDFFLDFYKDDNTITELDVVSRSLGRSIDDVVNYYFSYPTQCLYSPELMKAFGNIIYDVRSIRKYGLRPMHITFNAIDFLPEEELENNKAANNPFKETVNTKMKDFKGSIVADSLHRLISWYNKNDMFLSGSISVYGRDIRIGEPVFFESKDKVERGVYYVETVQQNFSYPNSWITVLGVTRGETVAE